MGKLKDMTGREFGRLTVIGAPQKQKGRWHWLCQCACQQQTTLYVDGANLRRGTTQSCGCLQREAVSKHRLSRHRLYAPYMNMLHRCRPEGEYWGKLGIRVCRRWSGKAGLPNFIADMDSTYFEGACLDRINPDDHYRPGNCRWQPRRAPADNRRNNRHLDFRGRTKRCGHGPRRRASRTAHCTRACTNMAGVLRMP